MNFNEDTITFGKYKDLSLSDMLRDRKYCSWLLLQEWFSEQYSYLYNRVKAHNPERYFVRKEPFSVSPTNAAEFLERYEYFSLCPLEELELTLTENEKRCYEFYLQTIETMKRQIRENEEKGENPYAIKAPTSWLKRFEERTGLARDLFKEFLTAYGLPNITTIVEQIKKVGGIEYKGAKSYLLVKERSLRQESFWEAILKRHYGEEIGTQYKFRNCFFDFIRIKTNTIYECKLGLKDFSESQYKKYLTALESFSVVYLIDKDCIVDLKERLIYTTSPVRYEEYFLALKNASKFEELIRHFPIIELSDVNEYF